MDFATNSLRVESITPEKADEYLACNYAHNRPRRQHHVLFLANEMRHGRFMSTAEIHLMFRNGEPVLVNGQHTCAAIIEYGKPVTVTVRKTIAKDAGQIALAYAFGHDTGLRRSFSDAVGAYNLAETVGLSTTQVNALATAIRHIKSGFDKDRAGGQAVLNISPADVVEYIYEWAGDAKILFNVVSRCDGNISRLLEKRGALSVAIVTIRYQPEKALEFWRGIAMPDGLAWTDPRMTARRKLEESKSKASVHGITPWRLSRQLARCWNAFYRDEPLSQVKVSDDQAPMVLLGTPYNGKQPSDLLALTWNGEKPTLQQAA